MTFQNSASMRGVGWETAVAFWPARLYAANLMDPVDGSFQQRETLHTNVHLKTFVVLPWLNQLYPLKAAAT